MTSHGFAIIRVKPETRDIVKTISDATGLKMWAIAEKAINAYVDSDNVKKMLDTSNERIKAGGRQ